MANGKYQQWLEPDALILLEGWARDGLTDEQIAHNMGVAYSTLRVWRDNYPAISAALKKGKEVADYQVENALLKRALGYEYIEERIERRGNKITVIQTTKEVQPDVLAQIYWLKNRRPGKWRDKPVVEDEKVDDPLLKLFGFLDEQAIH